MPTSLAEALDTALDKAKLDLSAPKEEAAPAKDEPAPPKAEEKKSEAPPAEPEKPAPAQPDKAQEHPPAEAGSEQEQLLSKEDLAEIQKNPLLSKAYKLMQGSLTRKSQDLAEKRKGIASYEPLIEAYQKDPKGTIAILAKQHDLEIAEHNGDGQPKDAPVKQDTLAILKEAFPEPELSFLPERLAPAFEKALAARMGEAVTPLQEFQQNLVAETAAKETAAVMEAFSKAHPDFPKHEQKIVELTQQILPAKGMGQREYLEILWTVATKDVSKAESIKEVVQKLNDAAAKSESSQGGVAAERVAPTPPKFKGLDDAINQAAEAARRGERWGAA